MYPFRIQRRSPRAQSPTSPCHRRSSLVSLSSSNSYQCLVRTNLVLYFHCPHLKWWRSTSFSLCCTWKPRSSRPSWILTPACTLWRYHPASPTSLPSIVPSKSINKLHRGAPPTTCNGNTTSLPLATVSTNSSSLGKLTGNGAIRRISVKLASQVPSKGLAPTNTSKNFLRGSWRIWNQPSSIPPTSPSRFSWTRFQPCEWVYRVISFSFSCFEWWLWPLLFFLYLSTFALFPLSFSISVCLLIGCRMYGHATCDPLRFSTWLWTFLGFRRKTARSCSEFLFRIQVLYATCSQDSVPRSNQLFHALGHGSKPRLWYDCTCWLRRKRIAHEFSPFQVQVSLSSLTSAQVYSNWRCGLDRDAEVGDGLIGRAFEHFEYQHQCVDACKMLGLSELAGDTQTDDFWGAMAVSSFVLFSFVDVMYLSLFVVFLLSLCQPHLSLSLSGCEVSPTCWLVGSGILKFIFQVCHNSRWLSHSNVVLWHWSTVAKHTGTDKIR